MCVFFSFLAQDWAKQLLDMTHSASCLLQGVGFLCAGSAGIGGDGAKFRGHHWWRLQRTEVDVLLTPPPTGTVGSEQPVTAFFPPLGPLEVSPALFSH